MDPRQFAARPLVLAVAGVLAVASFGACAGDRSPGPPPASVIPPPATSVPPPVSDLSELAGSGVDIGVAVVIDVAGDGRDRFLEARRNGVVDFGGTDQVDMTMMVLRPAAGRAANRVVINAPRWNPELGGGYCVVDTAGPAPAILPCRADDPDQIWHVVPVGDLGQFRLDGRHATVHVDVDRVTPDGTGRTGLQTVPFTG